MKDIALYDHGDGTLTTRQPSPGSPAINAVAGITTADIQEDRWKARQADSLRTERDAARAEAALWLARAARAD